MDGGEEIVVAFVVSGCDGAEVFELIEEAFDEIAIAVKERAERRDALAVRHRLHACPSPAPSSAATTGSPTTQNPTNQTAPSPASHVRKLNQKSAKLGILFMGM